MDNISALQDEINGYDALEQSIMATLSSLNQYKKALETPDQNDNFLYAQSQIESMQELEQPAIMKLDLTDVQDSYQQTVAILQQYIEAKNALESAQTLGIDTTDAESKLSSITEKLQSLESDGKLKTIGIDAEINTDEFYKQIEALNTDKLKKDNAKISVDANTTPYEQTKNKLIQDTNKETASIKIKANTTNFYTNLQQQLQTHVFTVNVKGQITGVSGGTVTSHGTRQNPRTQYISFRTGTKEIRQHSNAV